MLFGLLYQSSTKSLPINLSETVVRSKLWQLLPAFLLATLLGACQDRDLVCTQDSCQPIPPALQDNKVALQGDACTAAPNKITFPYKILFVIDYSGSNNISDPQGRRGDAVDLAITEHLPNPTVSFAAIRFSGQPEAIVPDFNRDEARLRTIRGLVNQAQNGTNYIDTLLMAADLIRQDVAKIEPSLRSRTRYDIRWLSDGEPAPCRTLEDVSNGTRALMQLRTELNLLDLQLHTLHLDYGSVGNCFGTSPADFLRTMAEIGQGTFTSAQAGNLRFTIRFDELSEPYEMQSFYLVNESRTIDGERLLPDSDRDGLSDEFELKEKTNPLVAYDTTSLCLHLVDVTLGALNKGRCAAECNSEKNRIGATTRLQMQDTDNDGLLDCEELALGTDKDKPDTDGDNFIDSLELRFQSNPVDGNSNLRDKDQDGFFDTQEIFLGLNPTIPDADQTFSYQYGPLPTIQVVGGTKGSDCVDFVVDNVRLAATKATPTSKAGENKICLYVLQKLKKDPNAQPTLSRSCTTAFFNIDEQGNQIKEPATGKIQLSFKNFETVLCPGDICKNRSLE